MKKEVLVDDLDGSTEDGVKEYYLAVGEVDNPEEYDLDLANPHYVELREAIARFVRAARPRKPAGHKLVSVPTVRGKKRTRKDPAQLKAIRDWIWAHPQVLVEANKLAGLEDRKLSSHGRIPDDLEAAYYRLAGKPAPNPAQDDGAGLFQEAMAH